jgi:lipid II:glycine glycyltransferase (peptidoglycan interpeptide bridge formation enzyme)
LLCQSGQKGEAALALLLETYKRQVQRNTLFTELRNLSDLSSLQTVLDDNNFHCEPHLNYLIDLNRSSEEVLQSIGRRTRKIIRRGLRKKTAKVSEVSNKHELAIWYSTIQKTYKKAHVPLASQDLFENTFDQLHHKGMAKFLVAKIDGEIAACSVELLYKDVIYGWYGGSDKGYSRYFPNEMLIWHILEWGSNNGFRVYDFGGAGKPDEEYGVRDFKAKFHGNLVNFGRNICIHSSRRFALSEFMYRIYRRFL